MHLYKCVRTDHVIEELPVQTLCVGVVLIPYPTCWVCEIPSPDMWAVCKGSFFVLGGGGGQVVNPLVIFTPAEEGTKLRELNGIYKGNDTTRLLFFFLLHTFTMLSKSPSDTVCADSVAIFIKIRRFVSLVPFLSLVVIIFIFEILRSTDAVPTGIDRQMLASVLSGKTLL